MRSTTITPIKFDVDRFWSFRSPWV